jgi:hypothetical protein
MKNLTLRLNFLEGDKFKIIQDYLESKEFQKDFPWGYWEGGSKASGRILEIKGRKIINNYANVTIKLRDDEDLNSKHIEENMDKLLSHYKKILEMIF